MVLGAAAGGLMSLGLALPTGWMFGYGYGHGVRSGYNAYKPSKNSAVNQLHLSSNPVQGAQGAGLLSAEHMMAQQEKSPMLQSLGATTEPSVANASSVVSNPNDKWVYSNVGGAPRLRKSQLRSHEDYVAYVKHGINPKTGRVFPSVQYAARYKRLRRSGR